jgi:hypothetical protein
VSPYQRDGAASPIGAELAQRTRAAQGLPAHIEDDGVLARIAALIANTTDDAAEVATAS